MCVSVCVCVRMCVCVSGLSENQQTGTEWMRHDIASPNTQHGFLTQRQDEARGCDPLERTGCPPDRLDFWWPMYAAARAALGKPACITH